MRLADGGVTGRRKGELIEGWLLLDAGIQS
jgi:hypothetical protein